MKKNDQHEKEVENIKRRYAQREGSKRPSTFGKFAREEREEHYIDIIRKQFNDLNKIKVLEIGAGGGDNILFFKRLGVPDRNIYANELLEKRINILKENFPDIHLLPGNAMDISEGQKFDIIIQSTVFTSILDPQFRQDLADKMSRLLTPGGIILWYDFIYNNPSNPDVQGVSVSELKQLFRNAGKIEIKKVTLAPPIGRRVGKTYPFINKIFPFLRTHVIAVIHY